MSARWPAGRFGAICADPPWSFETYGKKHTTPHRGADDHYKTLSLETIMGLPVEHLAAEDCVLFLWVVDSHIDVGIDVMRAWGFRFKTRAFTWVKTTKDGRPRMSMGYWTRKGSEICLMGTRGKPKRISAGVREVIMAPRREHSRKPEEFYAGVEALVGGPYLDLFSRRTRAGWTTWGNESTKFDAETRGDAHAVQHPEASEIDAG